MALASYRRFDLLAAIAAGAAASQFGTVWTALYFGWSSLAAWDVWKAVPINLMSGAVLSGMLGFMLARSVRAILSTI